uniref:Uncharacterized protein n=1 Tax=viral metagenome TaxID=1070528 RepID=A0A6C0AZT8_9ZZZZ
MQQDELTDGSFYFIIRVVLLNNSVERVDNIFATYNGTVGLEHQTMIRLLNVHKGSRKSAMELVTSDNTIFYSLSAIIPQHVFISNILSFL